MSGVVEARVPAGEFPADLEWVNVSFAPRLADLRGRVTLLWFFSHDAVNCWNLARELRALEHKYHDGLTVIGIHCPKYAAQRDPASVLRAVNRLGLRHAVASDPGFRVWQLYGITAWPSVVLIDAGGGLAARCIGEGCSEAIDRRIAHLLEEAAAHDLRFYGQSPPASRPEPRRALAFSAGVLAEHDYLYVADTGHHRVLECSADGTVLRRFGSGDAGFGDGVAERACFDAPHGLARWRDGLYVADRGNHAVRRIDLGDGSVRTVLGVGSAARTRPSDANAPATGLDTPLGLAVIGDALYVTIAGQHQVWRLDLGTSTVSVFAGSGELGLVDGDAADARLAQPSGIAALGRQLIVADAAASALRWVDADDGSVTTAVGSGLYDFGDTSGARAKVRLQNPLGVAADPRGTVYVADSYNHAIKQLNRNSGNVRALRIAYRLDEPQAISLHEQRLWIANTNVHEIACVDLSTGVARRVPVGEA